MRLGDFFQGSLCRFYWFIFVALEREINWRQCSVLSLNDLVVQSSSVHEPWLLMRLEARYWRLSRCPPRFILGVFSVSARWAHSRPGQYICRWTCEEPCSSSWYLGKDATCLSLWLTTPLVAGHMFPGLWLRKLFLFNLHLKQQTPCEHTCRNRYWRYHREHYASV